MTKLITNYINNETQTCTEKKNRLKTFVCSTSAMAGCDRSARVAACSRGVSENRDMKSDTICFPY